MSGTVPVLLTKKLCHYTVLYFNRFVLPVAEAANYIPSLSSARARAVCAHRALWVRQIVGEGRVGMELSSHHQIL